MEFDYAIKRLKNGIKDNERFIKRDTYLGLQKAVKHYEEIIQQLEQAIKILKKEGENKDINNGLGFRLNTPEMIKRRKELEQLRKDMSEDK